MATVRYYGNAGPGSVVATKPSESGKKPKGQKSFYVIPTEPVRTSSSTPIPQESSVLGTSEARVSTENTFSKTPQPNVQVYTAPEPMIKPTATEYTWRELPQQGIVATQFDQVAQKKINQSSDNIQSSNKFNLFKYSWDYLNNPKNIGIGFMNGVPLGPTPITLSTKPIVTFEKIKNLYSENLGLPGKVVGEFIPTTPLETTLFLAIPPTYSKLPTIARVGVSGYFGYTGIKTSLDKTQSSEKRIAGGIVGGLGVIGVSQEISPYIKGQAYKLFPDYKPVKELTTSSGQAYKGIKLSKDNNVALIPKGDTYTGTKPAYTSSAYGFDKEYQAQYIGTSPKIYSSARGLFSRFKNEIPISKDFFGTPQDIVTGQPQTRVSRLGTQIYDIFKFPKSSSEMTTISNDAQIVGFKETVTSKETVGTFQVGPSRAGATELEVFKKFGTIKKESFLGRTTIEGIGVKIYQAKLVSNMKYDYKVWGNKQSISFSPESYYVSPSGISSTIGIASSTKTILSSKIKLSTLNFGPSEYPLGNSSTKIVPYPLPPPPPNRPSGSSDDDSSDDRYNRVPPFIPPIISNPPSDDKIKIPPPPKITKINKRDSNFNFIFGMSTRKYKGKQRKKYTPSYEALVFKIKGKQKRGRETGLGIRPIPRNYSFAFNKIKLPKFRF